MTYFTKHKSRILGAFLLAGVLGSSSAYAQNVTTTSTTNADTIVQLIGTLQVGQRSDLVKILQATLAKDPTILEEKNITGYFGPLTRNAIKKYQKKNNLPQVGTVGPKTRALLNAELSAQPLVADATDPTCVKIPPGHLIAPGFIKKNGGQAPTAPVCMKLPPGIAKKMAGGWNGGTNNDTVAPIITLGAPSALSTTGATLNFTTNEDAVFEVMYGTSTAYGSSTTKTTVYGKTHTQALTGLSLNTTYYYQVKAYDQKGNMSATTGTVMTLAVADTTAPVISAVSTGTPGTTSATITWTTDDSATTKVYVSTMPVNTATVTATIVGGNRTVHSATVIGLSANTQYYFIVESVNGAGLSAQSTQATFTTAAPDVTAPAISAIVTTTTATTATITWATNENASSKIYISTTPSVVKASATQVSGAGNTMTHSVTATSLTANTQYYYLIESMDGSGNTSTSAEGSVTTLAL